MQERAGLLLDAGGHFCHRRPMDADERDIFNYLKTWGAEFVGVREICRRAGTKKRYHEDPEWPNPCCNSWPKRSILERRYSGPVSREA